MGPGETPRRTPSLVAARAGAGSDRCRPLARSPEDPTQSGPTAIFAPELEHAAEASVGGPAVRTAGHRRGIARRIPA